MFDREEDKLIIDAMELEFDIGEEKGYAENIRMWVSHDKVKIGKKEFDKKDLKYIGVRTKHYIVPREAMGRGDVKLLAMIGAFLGPAATLFTLMFATFSGLITGLGLFVTRRIKNGFQLPFGPHLVLGATIWLIWWQDIIRKFAAYLHGS